ncbi:MAG: hypothetical protein FJW23_15715 [Acidimicrobiia bacterium]|nr:hypothetical protein [Acidimicrobiia bacterium]
MTKTRVLLAVGGGVLIAGLATGLYLSRFGSLALSAAANMPELRLIPADAVVVAYADVRALMDSAVRRQLTPPNQPRRTSRLQEETGLNPETDIDAVLMALAPAGSAGDGGLLVVRGAFDEVRIERSVRDRGAAVVEYKGRRLFERASPENGMAVTFASPGVLVFGDAARVRAAIDAAEGAPSVTGNQALMDLVADLPFGQAWAAGRLDALAASARVPADLTSRLPAMSWFAASGRVDQGVEGHLTVQAIDESAAADLRQVVQGFAALARLQVRQHEALASVLDSLQIGGQGSTVTVGLVVPPAAVAALGAALSSAGRLPLTPAR